MKYLIISIFLLLMPCGAQKPNTIDKRLFKKELKRASKQPIVIQNEQSDTYIRKQEVDNNHF